VDILFAVMDVSSSDAGMGLVAGLRSHRLVTLGLGMLQYEWALAQTGTGCYASNWGKIDTTSID